MSEFNEMTAYLKSLIILVESMDKPQDDRVDLATKIGMLKSVEEKIGSLISTLESVEA